MAILDKLMTFARLSGVPADFLDQMQARLLPAPSDPSGSGLDTDPLTAVVPTATTAGSPPVTTISGGPEGYSRYGFTKAVAGGIAAGHVFCLDDSIHWTDRLLVLEYRIFSAGDSSLLPGGASDGQFARGGYSPAQMNDKINGRLIYTGNGILDAGAVNPTNGNPPSPGPGTAGNGDFVAYLLDEGVSTDLLLYVERNAPYRLCVYNQGASAFYMAFWLRTAAKLGKH